MVIEICFCELMCSQSEQMQERCVSFLDLGMPAMFSRNSSPDSVVVLPSTMVVPRRFMVFDYSFGPKVYDLYETINRSYALYQQGRIQLTTWGLIGRILEGWRYDTAPNRDVLVPTHDGLGYVEGDMWMLDHGVEVDVENWQEDPDIAIRMARFDPWAGEELESIAESDEDWPLENPETQ